MSDLLMADATDELEFPWNHILRRTIVLPRHKVLYVPVPKAGCTSLLWLLSDLAGQSPEQFMASATAEISPELTIHDTSLWDEGLRLNDLDPDERIAVMHDPTWFRFTLVRHPSSRTWSGWQSKLLLREPRFAATFGERGWFPRIPENPGEIVEDFRRFVAALAQPGAEDVHWCVQRTLVDALPLTHVGRMEDRAATLDALAAHVGVSSLTMTNGRANRAPLPMPAGLYDNAADAVMLARHRTDFEAFGYDPVEHGGLPMHEWEPLAKQVLPVIEALIDRHQRIGQLSRLAADRKNELATARRAERQLAQLEQRQPRNRVPTAASSNLEQLDDFEVHWGWQEPPLTPGFTAVLRVKNEAAALPWAMPNLLRAVRRVVIIDNGSTDGTSQVARRIAAECGASDRVDVHSYPFNVARCGPEHLGTPATSVHSLTYFYNWSFSHVRTTYALKWDGDMVLTDSGIQALRALEWQVGAKDFVITMPRYPLYVDDERTAFIDVGIANNEPWGWPNQPGYFHVKAIEWELPMWPPRTNLLNLPDWSCLELKHLNADEFVHWSGAANFADSTRTRRKHREWQVFHALRDDGEPPTGVVRIDAPAGTHVIDYVRDVWLRQNKSDLTDLANELRPRVSLADV